MKKGILSIAALAFVLLISFSSLSVKPAATATEKPSAPTVSQEKILSARFLNMLNHNFVYGEAFDYTDDLINDSVIALLDRRDNDNEDFISVTFTICTVWKVSILPPSQRISRSVKIMCMLFRAASRFISIQIPSSPRMRTVAIQL